MAGRGRPTGLACLATLTAAVLSVLAVLVAPARATTVQVGDLGAYRDALFWASIASGPQEIEITADFTIGGSDPTYSGNQPLTIDGNGHFISGGLHNRLLLSVGGQALIVNNLAFSNGFTTGNGGAIRAGGEVTVNNSTFTNNSAGQAGGAISTFDGVTVNNGTFTYNTATLGPGGAIDAGTVVTLDNSTFHTNRAADSTGGRGGAVYAGGAVTVASSTLNYNTAARSGGAMDGAAVTATNSTLTGNTAPNGGAISAPGAVTATSSTFTGNTATTNGGAINARESTVTDSTFTNNIAGAIGGAIRATTTVTATGSSFTGNTADRAGGAIRVEGQVTATNSTFTSNTAGEFPGGAISALESVKLASATVVANTAGAGANIFTGRGVESFGSVVAVPLGGGANCSTSTTQSPSSYSYADDTSCGFDDPTDDQALGNNPQLQTLANNGGPTQTRAPLVTSPLVDAIPAADCDPLVATDQRGETRPADGDLDGIDECDIGAVELQPPAVHPDARIRKGTTGAFTGNDIYNTTGAGQTTTGSAARGRTVTYHASIQNDAAFTDTIRLRGQPSTTRFTITYRSPTGTNITTPITNGTYTTPPLPPGATHLIKITVTVRNTTPPNASVTRTLTATSTTRPTITDTTKHTTRRT